MYTVVDEHAVEAALEHFALAWSRYPTISRDPKFRLEPRVPSVHDLFEGRIPAP